MRTNNVESPRPVDPPKDIVDIVSREKFKELITGYKKNSGLSETIKKWDNLFSHLGESSEKIFDIVDAIINNLEIENVIVSDKKIKKWLLPVRFVLRKISKLVPKKLRHIIRNIAIRTKFMGSYFGEASWHLYKK